MFGFDELMLPALIVVPFAGALFVALIPASDLSLARQTTSAVLLLHLAILLRCGALLLQTEQRLWIKLNTGFWSLTQTSTWLRLNWHEWFLALALWLAILSVYYLDRPSTEKHGRGFHILVLLLVSSCSFTLLVTSLRVELVAANLTLMLALFLVAQFGGVHRGSATLQCGIFFALIDILAMAALSFSPKNLSADQIVLWCLALASPMLARLLFPFLSPFTRALFLDCPPLILILFVVHLTVVGSALLLHTQNSGFAFAFVFANPFFDGLCLLAAFLSVLGAIVERSHRQTMLSLFAVHSSLFALIALNYPRDHHLAVSLIFTALLCLVFSLSIANLALRESDNNAIDPDITRLWFVSMILLVGIPYVGIGSSLWQVLMRIFNTHASNTFYLAGWIAVLVLYLSALSPKLRPRPSITSFSPVSSGESGSLFLHEAWLYFALLVILCAGAPLHLMTRGGS